MIIEHGLSGFDFVRAMLCDGFRVVGTTMGHTLIEKGDLELLVPQQERLEEDEILAFLEQVDVPPLRFVVLAGQLPEARAPQRFDGGTP
jgi:hypothetical protein